MAIKQKIVGLCAALGLIVGFSAMLNSPAAYGQSIPPGCPGSDVAGPPAPGTECPDTSGDPCSTVPSGWSRTLAACEEAVENGDDPCDAIYDILVADGNDAAEERRTACQEVSRSGGSTGGPVEETCVPSDDTTCCDKVKTSIISDDAICGTPDAEGGVIFGLLKWVLRIMTAGIGITAVGGIAYGALLYSSAENKPEQTKKAIGIITNVVIGLVAYGMMFVLLNYLIPGGVFS